MSKFPLSVSRKLGKRAEIVRSLVYLPSNMTSYMGKLTKNSGELFVVDHPSVHNHQGLEQFGIVLRGPFYGRKSLNHFDGARE